MKKAAAYCGEFKCKPRDAVQHTLILDCVDK